MQIFVFRNNQKYGPYSLDDIKIYLASGNLSGADMAWFEGATDWMPLSQIPGVQMPPGRTPPPPAPIQNTNSSPRMSIRQEETERMNARASWYYGRQLQGCVIGTIIFIGLFYMVLAGLSSWLSSPTSQQNTSNPFDQVSPNDTTNPLSAHYTPAPNQGIDINLNRDARKDFGIPSKLDSSDIMSVRVVRVDSDGFPTGAEYHDFCSFSPDDSSKFVALMQKAKSKQSAMRGSVMAFTLLPRRVDSKGNILPRSDNIVPLKVNKKDTTLQTYRIFVDEARDFERTRARQ